MIQVLVVDDDAGIRTLVRTILVRAGYEVREAVNGDEALRSCAEQPPDVIITDILMPDKDGVEVLLEVSRRNVGVPIVAISGGGLGAAAAYLETASHLGATATLAKPFSPASLLTTVQSVLTPSSKPGAPPKSAEGVSG
jgi:CheY-like chemotaxis protein